MKQENENDLIDLISARHEKKIQTASLAKTQKRSQSKSSPRKDKHFGKPSIMKKLELAYEKKHNPQTSNPIRRLMKKRSILTGKPNLNGHSTELPRSQKKTASSLHLNTQKLNPPIPSTKKLTKEIKILNPEEGKSSLLKKRKDVKLIQKHINYSRNYEQYIKDAEEGNFINLVMSDDDLPQIPKINTTASTKDRNPKGSTNSNKETTTKAHNNEINGREFFNAMVKKEEFEKAKERLKKYTKSKNSTLKPFPPNQIPKLKLKTKRKQKEKEKQIEIKAQLKNMKEANEAERIARLNRIWCSRCSKYHDREYHKKQNQLNQSTHNNHFTSANGNQPKSVKKVLQDPNLAYDPCAVLPRKRVHQDSVSRLQTQSYNNHSNYDYDFDDKDSLDNFIVHDDEYDPASPQFSKSAPINPMYEVKGRQNMRRMINEEEESESYDPAVNYKSSRRSRFVDSDEESLEDLSEIDATGYIRRMFRYDPTQYVEDDEDIEEAHFDHIGFEERKALRIAKREDQIEFKKMQQMERTDRKRKRY
jgi:hypothetical protein